MFGINLQATYLRKIITFLITVVLISGLVSCSDRFSELSQIGPQKSATISNTPKISEVSPPEIIQQLRQAIDIYQPQITIQNPEPDRIFEDNDISLQIQVQDLPIFKSDLDLGPYVEVILDDRHYTKIYDINEPLVLSDLEPGTHTLRVFVCSPWDESFKNEGAYAQTTFHILTKTAKNNPAPDLPLLTYNSPVGSYGEEPIMLDYYLTNAPLHSVAQAYPDDEIDDWRIRITVNGTSFITDEWQSIYLQGFHPGKNWVKLEYIDELGNPINDVYNNTVHLITYKPGGEDALSKIIRGEISLKEAFSIVDPEYIYEELQPEVTLEPELEPVLVNEPITKELEQEETFVEPQTEIEVESVPLTEVITEELDSEKTFVEPETEIEIEVELEETFVEPEIETEVESLPLTEPIIDELESEETFVEPEIEIETEVESLPLTEPIIDELESEETFVEPEIETEVESLPLTEPIIEELESEETFVEPEIETTSKVESTESETTQILKEKVGKLRNWFQGRFQGIDKVTTEQEKITLEETLNLPKESEIEDSLQQNEPSNLPEILEELPILQSAEEIAPEENSNLTSNPEEVTNSVEDSLMSVNEDGQEETTLELEEITEEQPKDVVESILPKSDDSATEVNPEIEPYKTSDELENLDDSTPDVNPEMASENTSDELENLDDSAPEVNSEMASENASDELENLDDSAPDVNPEMASENASDELENLDGSAPDVNPEMASENASDELENLDDSTPEVNSEMASENASDKLENLDNSAPEVNSEMASENTSDELENITE